MCFDAEGRGEQWLSQTDGTECNGKTTASFTDEGQLQIADDADVQCTGSSIYRRVMTCELEPDGAAACRSRQPQQGHGYTNVRIVRRESS